MSSLPRSPPEAAAKLLSGAAAAGAPGGAGLPSPHYASSRRAAGRGLLDLPPPHRLAMRAGGGDPKLGRKSWRKQILKHSPIFPIHSHFSAVSPQFPEIYPHFFSQCKEDLYQFVQFVDILRLENSNFCVGNSKSNPKQRRRT